MMSRPYSKIFFKKIKPQQVPLQQKPLHLQQPRPQP